MLSYNAFRYTLMKSCWKYNPKERPAFSDLVQSIEDIMAPLADYLDCKTIFDNSNNIYENVRLCTCKD